MADAASVVLFHAKLANPGGAERLFIEEYKFLRDRGMNVQVLTFAPCSPNAFYDEQLGDHLTVMTPRFNVFARVWALRNELKRLRPDVVVSAAGLRYLFIATRGLGVPYLFHQHEPPLKDIVRGEPRLFSIAHRKAIAMLAMAPLYRFAPQRDRWQLRNEITAWLDAAALRAASHITVLSQQSAQEVALLYNRSATVARGAIATADVSRVGKPRDVAMVLSVCRLSRAKRVDLIIDAFARLRCANPNVHLVIVGIGAAESELRRVAHTTGHGDAITFAGFVKDAELPTYFRDASVFVLADWADFDITLYEALTAGCTVVASSEMEVERSLVQGGFVLQADPVVDAYADGLLRAVAQPVRDVPDLDALTWDRYFNRALATILPRDTAPVA